MIGERRIRILFIHHSCGGQLLAPPGPALGEHCIYASHPNGGDLRGRLERAGYAVHEASYGSAVGERTDLFDWLPKFRSQMADVLACAHQDRQHPDGRRNDVVVFKSCFPNNAFVGEGEPPGDARGPELTLANARATMSALLRELRGHERTLFVYVTAPPLAPRRRTRPLESAARALLGRRLPDLQSSGVLARRFADWVRTPEGWLAGYPLRNVAVFDYFGILSAGHASGLSAFATRGGFDPHPSAEGNARAAAAFVPFIDEAVRRFGLRGVAPRQAASPGS